MSCTRAEMASTKGASDGSNTKPTYEITFDNVKSFLHEYRANLQRDRLWVPINEDLGNRDRIILRLKPPFFKQKIVIGATVVDRKDSGYDVSVEALTPKHKATLEAYTGLCESIWEECMKHLMQQVGSSLMGGSNSVGSETGGDTLTRHSLVPPPPQAMPTTTSLNLGTSSQSHPTAPSSSGSGSAEEETEEADPETVEEPVDNAHGGRLDKVPLPRALSTLCMEHATGQFKVHTEHDDAILNIYRGWLVKVTSPRIEARTYLGDILVKTGVIDTAARDSALRQAKERNIPLGQALIRTRRLTSRSLNRALERQLRARMVAVSRYKEGAFTFEESAVEPEGDSPPVNPVRVFYERYVRTFTKRTPHEVNVEERRVGGFVCPTRGKDDDFSALIMDQKERSLCEMIRDNPQNLVSVYGASPLSRRQTHAVVFALKELGLLEFKDKL